MCKVRALGVRDGWRVGGGGGGKGGRAAMIEISGGIEDIKMHVHTGITAESLDRIPFSMVMDV